MLLVVVLALAALASTEARRESFSCFTDGGSNLFPFKNNNWKIKMNWPCKYWALRGQPCGKYRYNLSPVNKWYPAYYQLDAMWLGITEIATGKQWVGRTTNKKVAKYLNSQADDDTIGFFTKKGGELETDDVFNTKALDNRWGYGASIKSADANAKLTFFPWDPMNTAEYKKSHWKFSCFDTNMTSVEYPRQMCGGADFKRSLRNMTTALGLKDRYNEFTHYYANFFINQKIVQTSKHCIEAENLLRKSLCANSVSQRMKVIRNCAPMLYNTRRTECLTYYNCHPMDAFNSCLRWGCKEDFEPKDSDNKPSELCKEMSENIYFCPNIEGPGNISARAYDSKCYKGFVRIEPPADEPTPYPEPDDWYNEDDDDSYDW